MLKLIAIRPLPGCRKSALKCLQVGQMYYLCNDFIISKDAIRLRDDYVMPLPKDFFSLYPNSRLNLNISAVVGMNGDGKSSLIELMMRLINNCAKHYRLTYKDKLLRVDGIKAELYYLLNDTIYCIRETADDKYTYLLKCADISDYCQKEWKFEKDKEKATVNSVSSMKELFYTVISNYSLYAYNTKDFKEEWDDKIQSEDEREKCWLHYLFHKNDGYRTPMTIHPYRDKGNIDINRENELTLPRLTALYIQEPDAVDDDTSFRWIDEKYADVLQLTEQDSSKLQEKTIIQYFKEVKKISLLQGTIKEIESVLVRYNGTLIEGLIEDEFGRIENCLDFITGQMGDEKYRVFLDAYMQWSKKRNGIYSKNSDIKLLLNRMYKFNQEIYSEKAPYGRFDKKYRRYARLGVKHLVRLRLVYEVLKEWGFPTDMAFKDYENLNDIERCQQYIAYKTINICETYPVYIEIFENKGTNWKRMPTSADIYVVSDVIRKIKKDDSHITLKIRQCLNFISILNNKPDFLDSIAECGIGKDGSQSRIWWIPFENLKKHFGLNDFFPIHLLPPPIYNSEIIYKTPGGRDVVIPYAYLSSGEKQLLNNIGVLLYHLRNLDSVVEGEAKCRNVNIILEEIELYFHPEFQRQIVKILIEKLQAANFKDIENINITFVTHSPFILSDIPMCNVLLLKDGSPAMECMQENTFGSNIHGMLKNGFFLPSLPIGEFAHEKINGLFDRLNRFKIDSRSRQQRDWFYSNIMRVGEPYIREQLMKLFHMHYPIEYYD